MKLDPVEADMQPLEGRSLTPIFESEKDGRVVAERDHVFDKYPYAGSQRNFHERFTKGEIKGFITGWVKPGHFEKEPVE